jgi:hypothetical protein
MSDDASVKTPSEESALADRSAVISVALMNGPGFEGRQTPGVQGE